MPNTTEIATSAGEQLTVAIPRGAKDFIEETGDQRDLREAQDALSNQRAEAISVDPAQFETESLSPTPIILEQSNGAPLRDTSWGQSRMAEKRREIAELKQRRELKNAA